MSHLKLVCFIFFFADFLLNYKMISKMAYKQQGQQNEGISTQKTDQSTDVEQFQQKGLCLKLTEKNLVLNLVFRLF